MAKVGTLERMKELSEEVHSSEQYEVRCQKCDVSYPVGTKRCMYCGGRPGRRALFVRDLHPDPLADFAPLGEPKQAEVERQPSIFPGESPADEEEGESPRTTVFRILGNLSWIILFIAITVYQRCAAE